MFVINNVPVICAECRKTKVLPNGNLYCEEKRKEIAYGSKPTWCPLPPLVEEITPIEYRLRNGYKEVDE